MRRAEDKVTGAMLMKFWQLQLAGLRWRFPRADTSADGVEAQIKPDEVYHLGAQSHVRVSFDMPEYTSNVTGGIH